MAGHIQTSKSVEWNTPESILKPVREFFGGLIHLDPCSNPTSTVGALASFSLPVDGLAQQWNYPTIFCNPPYNRDKERKTSIKDWIAMCNRSYWKYNSKCIALIPASVDTKPWHESIFDIEHGHHKPASAICFLKGRVKFAGKTSGPAPMACALIYWGPPDFDNFRKHFRPLGYCVDIHQQLLNDITKILAQGHV
jgi:hypothetical protein